MPFKWHLEEPSISRWATVAYSPEILAGRRIRRTKAWFPETWVSVLQNEPIVSNMAEAISQTINIL